MIKRPTTIVLFGITGDLARKKLLPSLYDLYVTKRLKNTKIVGFSRRSFSQKEIKEFVRGIVKTKKFDKKFLNILSYVQGNFSEESAYHELAKHLNENCDKEFGKCSNKLFYLAVPPSLYETICTNISHSGLSIPCGGKDGFARILIEKPFGNDLKTAEKLDILLGKLFHESQIYRIDHYLVKESIFKIIRVYRKDLGIMMRWGHEHISKVEVNLFQKDILSNANSTYDNVGAFRDVGQNHMLQILALLAMDIPEKFENDNIQKAKAGILKSIIPASKKDIIEMKRGQYGGYLSLPTTSTKSKTETFFSIRVRVREGKLKGVPFVLTSGKGLSKNRTEVVVTFKDGIKLVVDVPSEDSLPAYQKILLDCIAGDQTVFISTPEILAEWKFVTPIILKTSKNKPFIYKIGSDPDSL